MEYKYFENLSDELPSIPSDSIVSHTIANDAHIKIILFGFSAGQELSEHTSTMPAIIEIIQGKASLKIGGDDIPGRIGTWVYMPPNLEHSLFAETDVTMLLYLLKLG